MPKAARIAWFSALNFGEAENSVAAYFSEQVLPILSRSYEIELFHDSFKKHPKFPTNNFLEAFSRHQRRPYDLYFYQIENQRSSDFVRAHLGLMPGIVLFHDLRFSDKGPPGLLSSPWCRKIYGEELDWIKSAMAYREMGLAEAVIFSDARHCEEYQRSVSKYFPEKPWCYLPFPASCSANNAPRDSGDSGVVALCASTGIERRAHKVLEALGAFPDVKLLWMISAGELSKAKELLGEFDISNVQLFCGNSPEEWAEIVKRASIAIHGLFSVWGQLGPYLQISLAQGLPCLVTEFASSDYLPENLVFKVAPGTGEASEWRLAIECALGLASQAKIANAAREYALSNFSPQIVADELAGLFDRHLNLSRRALLSREILIQNQKQELFVELTASFADVKLGAAISPFSESGWNL